jgi:hypothetical protein
VDYLCPECESDVYPELFLVTVPGGAFKSTDGGMSWEAIGLNDVRTFQALAIDPTDTLVVYAGTDAGLFKTTNGGTTWLPTGLSTTDVRTIAIDPVTPETVYAGTGSGVFKSIDGGATWSATGVMQPATTAVSAVSLVPTSVVGGRHGHVEWPRSRRRYRRLAVQRQSGCERFQYGHCCKRKHDGDVCGGHRPGGDSNSVRGGASSTGTVTLSAAAPSRGVIVTLSSSQTSVAVVPSAITVPAGATGATFTISTKRPKSPTTVTISSQRNLTCR